MNWIFSIGVSGFSILFYSVLLNGLVGYIAFQIWKFFERIWNDRGTYQILYGFLKVVILLFLIPFCWIYVTFKNHEFDTGISYNWYPWVNNRIAGILLGLFIIWLLGAMHYIKKYAQEKRNLRNIKILGQKITEDELHSIYSMVPSELIPKRKISIVICKGISSPMVAGFFHKCIYIPNRDYDQDTISLILSHELTHVFHKDLLFKNLCAAVTIIYWFCPFLQGIFWKYDCWSEVLCDMELCVGKMAKWTAKEYYSVLLREIERTGNQNLKMCSALYETEKTIKWRVESMKNYHRMEDKSKTLAYVLTAVFIISCPLTVIASGNVGVKGIKNVYEKSLTCIEEDEESQLEFMDPSLEQYGKITENEEIIIVPEDLAAKGMEGYTWDISKGATMVLSEVTLKEGASVTLVVNIISGSGPVDIGLFEGPDKRYVSISSSGPHIFKINKDGKYSFYVENKGKGAITVEFLYSYY